MYINESDLRKQIPILKKQGVKGYLKKNVSTNLLLKAIRQVFDGQEYFDVEKVVTEDTNTYEQQDVFLQKHNLSSREADIIRLLTKGHSSKKIGKLLNISDIYSQSSS